MRKLVLLPLCLMLSLSACNRPAPVTADKPAPSATPAVSQPGPGQGKELAPGNQTTAQLPPIPPVPGEDQLQSVCQAWIDSTPQNKSAAARNVITTAAQLFADDETAMRLFMYKYLVRYLVQQELASKSEIPALSFFTLPDGQWRAFNPEWRFEPFEEATYNSLYGTDNTKVFPNATWSTQILLAIRSRDLPAMLDLHQKAGFGDAPQWPLEVYRQLFTYGTTQRGEKQWASISRVLADRPLQGICWVEMGYGTGMIFPTLRRELGDKSTIIGTEIDKECERFVKRLEKTGKAAWGHVDLRPSALNDCLLPENSVDFIHPGMVHIGDGPEETWQRDWIPLLASMKKALKPGGLIIIDNGGSPPIDAVRRLMDKAGFEEVAYGEDPCPGGDSIPVYYASYRAK